MEAMALDLVKGSIESLLKAIVIHIGEEIGLVWGLKADLKNLQKELTKVNELLLGAESKFGSGSPESENPVFKEWVSEVAEVAYRAEDVIEEYAYEVVKRKFDLADMVKMQLLQRLKTRVRLSCFSNNNPVVLRFRMAHKVKSLRESIVEVYAKAKELGINPLLVASSLPRSSDHPTTVTEAEKELQLRRENVDYEGLIGRDHIIDQIKEQIRQASYSNKRLTVIGVFGMAGLGKTTVSRSIFKGADLDQYFQKQLWICVSHDFDFQGLLRGMLEQLGERSTMSDEEAIKKSIRDKLQGKKFFLVLDDVWGTFGTKWEPLRCCLQDMSELKGNTILVTSRSKEVLEKLKTYSADPMQPMDDPCIHELPRLTPEDSWSLFKQRVGDDMLDSTTAGNTRKETKTELGRKMWERCGHVPLAIRTLADLLRSRKDINLWKEIEASGIWSEEDNITLPSIKLSFKYLPSVVLKKCFVYCAIFQEDEKIEKDRLIQLWMAQGFLRHSCYEMERVGEQYFHVLLNNSLFQDVVFDDLGNVISCKMHDAVHALARALSENGVAQRVQHLSLLDNKQQGLELELGDALRTLFLSFNPTMLENVSMKGVKCLRALSLVGIGLQELSDSIGELKHLRYLDISKNEIKSLPDGFVKLYNLQTVRVFSGPLGKESIPMFPKGLNKLVNLRQICGSRNERMGIPVGLGMLTCLQTLPIVIDASLDWGGKLSELQTLCKLKGSLMIHGLECVEVEEAQKVELGLKENIKELTLSSSPAYPTPTNDAFLEKEKMVVEALQPHPKLASLTIENYYGKALPQWVLEMKGYDGPPLSDLVCFENYKSTLSTSLKNLNALMKLELISCTNVISFPDHLECLTSLRKLEVSLCDKMENIAADITPLVSLRMVKIRNCGNMTCLPRGISNLPSLETLEIGEFSQELDVFPFPEAKNTNGYDHDVLPSSNNLNGNGIIVGRYFESLVKLNLLGNGMDKVKSLPNPIRYLHQLRLLGIWSFSGLEALPEWLSNLTSLRELQLRFLLNLKCLPSQAAIEHLTQLEISACPLLSEACARETGTEWSKIKFIPHVTLDYKRLANQQL